MSFGALLSNQITNQTFAASETKQFLSSIDKQNVED